MSKLGVWVWSVVMLVSLAAFGSAFADSGSTLPPPDAQNLAALWPMVGVLIATIAGWGIPKLAAAYSFFHTGLGAVALGCIGAAIGGVSSVLQAGHFTWAMLAWAALSAATTFFSRLNPSTTKEDPPVKSPAAKLGGS